MYMFSVLSSMIYALTADASGALSGLKFEPLQFVKMLSYMGKGMLVIFVLIGVIILVTVVAALCVLDLLFCEICRLK